MNSQPFITIAAAMILSSIPPMLHSADKNWRERAVDRARIMSALKWSPVAEGMPIRGRGEFDAGKEYVGMSYSNGGRDGRMVGFDVSLATYLAALENPQSVLYTTDLRGQRRNSAAFYGIVCSGFTSYSLGLGFQIGSLWHGQSSRDGVRLAEPQSAQGAIVGDVLWMSGHVELVTGVTTAADGTVTHVRVEESRSPTARSVNYTAERFDAYLARRNITLYHIYDYDAWRGENRAERFRFPNPAADASPPAINRVLLLDLGDWVVYPRNQAVKFNVMDRDGQGPQTLVIQRGDQIIERIALSGTGVVERTFSESGGYSAYCILQDGSSSQSCEFSVCSIEVRVPSEPIALGEAWDIEFEADNMKPLFVRVGIVGVPNYSDPITPYEIWLTDEDRRTGSVTVPGDAFTRPGNYRVAVSGENQFGRLRDSAAVAFFDSMTIGK